MTDKMAPGIVAITACGFVLAVTACAPTQSYPPLLQRGVDPSQWGPAVTPWTTDTSSSVASGEISCVVKRPDAPLMAFIGEIPSGLTWRYLTAITGDGLYPGSTVYLSVDGERFSGEERIELTEDLLAALKNGERVFISWSPWPWGDRRETSVSLSGFSTAYDKCLANLDRLRD
jgi:hypothetical protein